MAGAEEEPVPHPADRLVGGDALHAGPADAVGGHGPCRLPDDLGQVDGVDDLLRERDEVDPLQHGVDQRVEVHAFEHDPGEVDAIEHRPYDDLEVHPVQHQPGEVESVQHGVDVEPSGDTVDVEA